MEYSVRHDAIGTHLDWTLEDVTARQIDWFGAIWKSALFYGIPNSMNT